MIMKNEIIHNSLGLVFCISKNYIVFNTVATDR